MIGADGGRSGRGGRRPRAGTREDLCAIIILYKNNSNF